ncbi:ALQxL family class IV lanthipeptide [Streptosporangium sp. NPDC002544]
MELDINSLDMLPSKMETPLYPCRKTCLTLVSAITVTITTA